MSGASEHAHDHARRQNKPSPNYIDSNSKPIYNLLSGSEDELHARCGQNWSCPGIGQIDRSMLTMADVV
uniref:Uncharacterized protein n=1 Tax=Oryza brachyantha TaxID=4533 RepID=J3N2H0_ORYBR